MIRGYRIDAITGDIAVLDARIEAQITPFAAAVRQLDEVPGSAWPPTRSWPRPGWTWAAFPPPGNRRIARRRGAKKANVAIGRSILVIIWHLLSDPDACYTDLGSGLYASRTDPHRRRHNHVRQLEALGYTVTLERAACATAGPLASLETL